MDFSLGCELAYKVSAPTTLILNVEAMRAPSQTVLTESFMTEPAVRAESFTAKDGNRYRRLLLDEGSWSIRYEAQVRLEPRYEHPAHVRETPVAHLPLEVLPYLNPSRYVVSDTLARFANREFGELGSGHERVTAICNWIHERVDYLRGSSDASTTAADTFALRAGVCRDFAHLGIAFCRALGIPARFVSCYAWQLEPQDFHAVFEAFLDGRWYLFDATRQAALDGMVRIGTGLDAAATAFSNIYGTVEPMAMRIWIEPVYSVAPAPWTVDAVSLADV